MTILKGTPEDILQQAADMIISGGTLAIPTETVYGLAADITLPAAIRTIFELKNRPLNHPLIVHIAKKEDIRVYANNIPDYVDALIEHFWPGPLTLILERSAKTGTWVTGGQDTVAIRMPSHPLTLTLINKVGHPLAAPSANKFGRISPTCAEHVIDDFNGQLTVLDGGACQLGIESTIVNAIQSHSLSVLRPGHISIENLQQALKHYPHVTIAEDSSSIRAPGKMLKHYAPQKPVLLFSAQHQLDQYQERYQQQVYLLHYSTNNFSSKFQHKLSTTPGEFAKEMYHQLRIADASAALAIAIECPPESPEWLYIYDRLKKSSATEKKGNSTHHE